MSFMLISRKIISLWVQLKRQPPFKDAQVMSINTAWAVSPRWSHFEWANELPMESEVIYSSV
jgi:hypothetical protein